MSVNKFADFNVKSDKGKTPLTASRCADNRQLFERTAKKGRYRKMSIYSSKYIYSENDVRKMWQRSYGEQVGIAQEKCIEAITRTKGKLSVSFSGGKDSAVLLLLMAEMWSISKYKNEPLHVMYSNTTNEFVCMMKYVKDYCEWIERTYDIQIILHKVQSELNYFQVTDLVGMPFVSKKVSRMVRDCKSTFKRLGLTYPDVEHLMPEHYTPKHYDEMLQSAEKLRELGFNHTVILHLTKITSANRINHQMFLPLQYRPMIDFDVDFSDQCCKYLKKDPIKAMNKELGGMLPVTGEMACNSKDRLNAYRMTGCNMFDGDRPKSKPLGAMTEQTLLKFIFEEKPPIAPPYGELSYNPDTDTYRFSGEQRTGCKLCGFGLHFDTERFIRLQKIEPNIVKFAFTDRERGGLGYTKICTFLNEKCGMHISIPVIEQGYYEKRALEYKMKRGEPSEENCCSVD